MDVRFAANVDPRDLERALEGATPAETLIVVASKTFTTQETMANAERAKRWGAGEFYAISANVEAAKRFGVSEVLPMWDWVGGRYSVWSAVDYPTAPVLWGAEGTVSQHSFHQLLHQGTQVVPADFIDLALEENLSANARAQADALAFGTDDRSLPPYRQYPGNRPSSMLFLDGCTPRNLGRLIALYEHKVFVQGVIWNINSYDQWGVELGKEMAKKLLYRR